MNENDKKLERGQEIKDIEVSASKSDSLTQTPTEGLTIDYVFSAKDSVEVPDQVPQKSEFYDEMKSFDPNITIEDVQKVEDHKQYDQFMPALEPNAGTTPAQPVEAASTEAMVPSDKIPPEVASPLSFVQAPDKLEDSAIVLEQHDLEQNTKHEVHYEALEDNLSPTQKRRFSRLRIGIICLASLLVIIIVAMIFSFIYGFKTSADQMISDSARASDITNIISAIGAYRMDHNNKCPARLEDLYEDYLSGSVALNIRKDYVYKISNSKCTISVPFDNEKNLLRYSDDVKGNGFWYDRVSTGSDL